MGPTKLREAIIEIANYSIKRAAHR